MDDTQASSKSTTDAGATRKRRSSILKSQRPPRTPLSELEFNVATPTDTAKSRRVSFSRRTGVAEFVTNEATTTWKNFYEEHNKSLETSGNESAAIAPRHMSIGHIGKRIFDQQFEEVEIVDIGGTLQQKSLAQDFHTSLNNLNITQQLASLECLDDNKKVTAPLQNFDLSSFTANHQSKVFGDDFSVSVMPEMSNPININISIQPVNSKDDCDDLDEIVKDLERSQPANIICPGPFNSDNMSEYIEVDLNMTHVAIKNDESEMSITDTIRNPEVQEVSKSISSIHNERKINDKNDWIVDKENIAINPYVTPKDFKINECSDKILVFDGKKLTVKSERETIPNLNKKDNFRTTLLPDHPTGATPKRKTIVLNTNDDLPNFMPDNSSIIGNQCVDRLKDEPQFKQSDIYRECDLSFTQAVGNKVEIPKRKTIVFEDDNGNISITQAVPAKVIVNKEERRKTIIYESDNANLSVTQAVPTNIIAANKTIIEERKTVVYEDDISFTRALPANLILNSNTKASQDKTMYYQDDADISITQVIPQNIVDIVKNKSNSNISNISLTQAIPTNILDGDVKPIDSAMTLIYDAQEDEDIEITQAVSNNVLLSTKNCPEKRKTIVFEDDAGDISVTQAVPAKIVFETFDFKCDTKAKILENKENTALNKSSVCSVQVKTELNANNPNDDIEKSSNRRRTIIYDDAVGDISMTQVIPTNIIVSKETEIVKMDTSSDHDITDISVTRPLPTNIFVPKSENQIKEETSSPHLPSIDNNVQKFLTNVNTSENKDVLIQIIENNKSKRQSELHESSGGNLSITKPIPTNIIDFENEIFVKETELSGEKSLHTEMEDLLTDNISVKQDIFIYQAAQQSISQSKIESSTEESHKCLLSKENSIKNDSDVTESKNSLNNDKINQSSITEKQSIDNECVSQKNSMLMRESISKHLDENLKVKKSFLNELLDMSNASLETVGKFDVSAIECRIPVDKSANDDVRSNNETKSCESLFVITTDKEDDVKESVENCNILEPLENYTSEPKQNHVPALENVEEIEDVQDLHNQIAELKAVNQPKRTSNNRYFEKVVSSDVFDDRESLNKSTILEKSIRKSKPSFKNADDTRELLGMLSDLTEGATDELQKDKPITNIDTKDNLGIDNNFEPKRFNLIPKRQSIALRREDLLNNISMAQAALQQSKFEIDENESIEDTRDSPEETVETDRSRRKSVRISNEVVKTLQFEEEDSISEANLQSSVNITPLKKTAFGESSYMRESKAKVIPSYLKDVSDNLKALMNDLVKPTADVMPFESARLDKSLKPSVSTCSLQMQANLMASSQIDVELHSNGESVENFENVQTNRSPIRVVEKPALPKKGDRTLTHSFQSASMDVDRSPVLQTSIKRPIPQSAERDHVIVFDHSNPLNNILLAPIDGVKVHKYNPIKSTETMHSERDNFTEMGQEMNVENLVEVERFSAHYNICQQQSKLQSGDSGIETVIDSSSLICKDSKPISIDRSTDGVLTEVKSTEVNTLIAMKGNAELLEASSSLTLVDDTLARSVFDVKIESRHCNEASGQKSPLRVIYKMETDGELLQKIDSDVTSTCETDEDNDTSNRRKRSYSPTKQNEHAHNKSNVDVTPKPVNKIQKMSSSPQVQKKINDRLDELLLCLDKIESIPNMNEGASTSPPKEKSPKKKSPKRDKIVVQRVSTEYGRERLEKFERKTLESIDGSTRSFDVCANMGVVSSFTSSKDVGRVQAVDSAPTIDSSISPSSMNWPTDRDESSRIHSEYSSTVNVVDRINMLKFIGRDCEWESSAGDTWMFRFLRSRIRLTARLSHRHHNASRSRVLADTPLEAVTVESVQQEAKDPLAAVCVRFAAEAMRYECAREGRCARAADVPALLRRCAHVARVALRWARAMRDARAHLAYHITPAGDLTLKVANIPLRCVWEVRLRLRLAVGDAREGAWPQAGDVRARAVLPAAPPGLAAPDLSAPAACAPRDWRHAPATIWTVFRYLKKKTRDDDHFLDL